MIHAHYYTLVSDLESEVMRDLGSIPTVGNIFHWIFLFSRSKASAANIWHYCHSCAFRKNSVGYVTTLYLVYFRQSLTTVQVGNG